MGEATTGGTLLPVPHEAVVFRKVSDGAVLLDTADEIYFGLNGVGARIWELLDECEDHGELVRRLGEDYPDAPAERRSRDVDELLDDLRENGLLVDRT